MRLVRLSWVAGALAGLVFGGRADLWAGLSTGLAIAWFASAAAVAALALYGHVARAAARTARVRAEVLS